MIILKTIKTAVLNLFQCLKEQMRHPLPAPLQGEGEQLKQIYFQVQHNAVFIISAFILIFSAAQMPSFSGEIKFAQLSDIHYSTDREDTSYKLLSHTQELLEDAVKQINSEKNIKFTIVTGDGIDMPDRLSLYGLIEGLNKLKSPWYITLGNHDTVNSEEVTKSVFFETIKENNKKFKFDKPYYTFKPKRGFRVIVMDGAAIDKRVPYAYFPENELQWLDDVLASSKKDTVLIFQHFPLIPPYKSQTHEIQNTDEYEAVLNKYKMPIAVFSGHYHAAKITKRGNIIHASAPALVTYPNAFRIVKVHNYRKKAVFTFDFRETGLKDLQQTAKMRIAGDTLLYGREQDRNTEITIEKK